MSKYYRHRLSIEVDEETFNDLNKFIGVYRIKNALFSTIAQQLVSTMKQMDERRRRIFIAAILDSKIKPSDYLDVEGLE